MILYKKDYLLYIKVKGIPKISTIPINEILKFYTLDTVIQYKFHKKQFKNV